jgi:UDP-N-acetylmuramoylalanine--D-glutamate ligase
MDASLRNKRVTVMGLGKFDGGTAVARWLAECGARVTATDLAPAEKLAGAVEQLRGLDVTLRLGGHDEPDFRDADMIVVNPAVPPTSRYLQIATAAGVPITTEINLFVQRCNARCVGVTGSVGKSTITAMIGHMLQNAFRDGRTWVGGNIGKSLLFALPEIAANDLVVLELSSFQLERTPLVRWSPHIGIIAGVTPNHLDWHGSFDAYLAAKLNLVAFQNAARDRIIIEDTRIVRDGLLRSQGPREGVWRYSLESDVPTAKAGLGEQAGCGSPVLTWPELTLDVPGAHNRLNAAAALSAAHLLGVDRAAAMHALRSFEALPHRLQRVVTRGGVSFYNDSKSTTPEAAITAMRAIDAPILVILGGYDKGIDLSPAAKEAAQRAKFAACIGKTGPVIAAAVREAGGVAEVLPDLAAGVAACRSRALAGDAVLLSPACASWDQFEDYRARGEAFSRLVSD